MPTDTPSAPPIPDKVVETNNQDKPQSSPAQRALEEAAARRKKLTDTAAAPEEIGGRGGLDPSRYGDWEVKGITSDF
ncbi:MAG: DUF1674 domain-containing protein [Methylocystaceae bacterium]|nr:DUF1674 domain-containing protein [Methylocystaceae bacterium]NBV94940.1 DUF1674 domain-containing protein [Methylocystaceae bacterium]